MGNKTRHSLGFDRPPVPIGPPAQVLESESRCRARLDTGREDRSMTLQDERLRSAIDRKQRVILAVIRALRNHPETVNESP